METETQTEVVTPSLSDENISQADYERLRAGETVEVEKSAPAKEASEKEDESDASKNLEAKSDDDSEGEESDESTEGRPKKSGKGFKKRIDKLNARIQAKEQEAEYWRNKALESEKPSDKKTEVVEAKTKAEGRPKADDFETYEEYIESVAEWTAEQKFKAKEVETEKKAVEQSAKQKLDAHNQRVDAYKEANPDFQDLAEEFFEEHGEDFRLSGPLTEAIAESDNGAALLHELLKNQETLLAINSMNPSKAFRELGKIEARLEASSEQKAETKIKTTKAPPPAKTMNASGASAKRSVYDADKLSQAEYERMRFEQEKRRASY